MISSGGLSPCCRAVGRECHALVGLVASGWLACLDDCLRRGHCRFWRAAWRGGRPDEAAGRAPGEARRRDRPAHRSDGPQQPPEARRGQGFPQALPGEKGQGGLCRAGHAHRRRRAPGRAHGRCQGSRPQKAPGGRGHQISRAGRLLGNARPAGPHVGAVGRARDGLSCLRPGERRSLFRRATLAGRGPQAGRLSRAALAREARLEAGRDHRAHGGDGPGAHAAGPGRGERRSQVSRVLPAPAEAPRVGLADRGGTPRRGRRPRLRLLRPLPGPAPRTSPRARREATWPYAPGHGIPLARRRAGDHRHLRRPRVLAHEPERHGQSRRDLHRGLLDPRAGRPAATRGQFALRRRDGAGDLQRPVCGPVARRTPHPLLHPL